MSLDLEAIKKTIAKYPGSDRPNYAQLVELVAEVERLGELADFARLLGPARMVLDRCALNGGDQERQDAADMAQRIVDLIGHPVTDEPPHAIVERDELRAEVERLRAEVESLQATIDELCVREAE